MALNEDALRDALTELFSDPPIVWDGEQVDYPESRRACAHAWAEAARLHAVTIVPASTTTSVAALALEAALALAFALPDARPAVDLAFVTFASAIGGGMAGFVAISPTDPPGFTGDTSETTSVSDAVDYWADAIHGFMRAGKATPIGGGSPVFWS